jgi:hypothetical protein
MPTKLIINCETGEQTEVELTAEEIAQRDVDAKAYEAEKKAQEVIAAAKAKAKEALLVKLGITAEEAALLLS